MVEVSVIGVDLAKNVFQVHGAAADGSVVFRRKLRRGQVLSFFAEQPVCTVAMEACASAHYWARAIGEFGHTVKLIPPAYVKPFVKRQKSDATDAEAIAEAAARATMRFVAVRTAAQQASAMVYRTRDLFVQQRTRAINALRGHLADFGVVAPTGVAPVGLLTALIEDEEGVLPDAVVELARVLLAQIDDLSTRIDTLDKEIRERAAQDEAVARLMTMPGIGVITATALVTFAPAPEVFAKGRDFAGLTRGSATIASFCSSDQSPAMAAPKRAGQDEEGRIMPATAPAHRALARPRRAAGRAYAPWRHAPMQWRGATHLRHGAQAHADQQTLPPPGTARPSRSAP